MASDETLKQNNEAFNQVLQVLGEFRREVDQSIGNLRSEIHQSIGDLRREMNERLTIIEADLEQIKQSQFSFDVRLDRVQAMAHDALNIGHDLKADVKILTAELRARAAGRRRTPTATGLNHSLTKYSFPSV